MLIIRKGANDKLNPKMISSRLIKKAKYVHLASVNADNAFKTILKAKRIAKQGDVPVGVDPGTMMAERGFTQLKPLLKDIDYFFPSKRELEIICQSHDFKKNCEKMKSLVKTLVVTLGSQGCFIKTENDEYFVKSKKVKAIDTTGAGDSFAAGLMHGIFKGKDLKESAKIGLYCAGKNVQKIGAKKGMPFLHQLPTRFQK